MGGKLVVLSATLPTLGAGALKNREDPKLLGTPKVRAHRIFSYIGMGLMLSTRTGVVSSTSSLVILQNIRYRLLTSSNLRRYVFVQCGLH
jgi:hypothetical protein